MGNAVGSGLGVLGNGMAVVEEAVGGGVAAVGGQLEAVEDVMDEHIEAFEGALASAMAGISRVGQPTIAPTPQA